MKHFLQSIALTALFVTISGPVFAQDDPQETAPAQAPAAEAAPAPSAAESQTYVIKEEGRKAFTTPEQKDYYKQLKANKSSHLLKLKVKHKKTSEWLDTDVWFNENGFSKPDLDRTEDGYTYKGIASKGHYDYEANYLQITDPEGKVTTYDFTSFGRHPHFQPFVHYAIIKDNILYVALAHNTYIDTNPDSSFMLAISLNSDKIIWRSKNTICNAANFLLIDDTIICGYGFTNEPDFVYTVNRHTGDVIEKIPVKSGPDYFILKDNAIRVATYNTDYTFSYK